MSILGTCPECLHHTDGMCDLRPRICLNYDHFERRPMVTLTRDDFEKLYISRAAYDELNAKVAALQAALEEEGRRNAVFTACLHKAQNLYLEAHPDYPGWPDGAVNITWVLEAFDKERAEVKRLQTALDAAINMNIEKNAEVVRLTAALAAANEDSARLAIVAADGSCCVLHDRWLNLMIDEDEHAADCPITLHRARVGGTS